MGTVVYQRLRAHNAARDTGALQSVNDAECLIYTPSAIGLASLPKIKHIRSWLLHFRTTSGRLGVHVVYG
jgi:hypothetical protein